MMNSAAQTPSMKNPHRSDEVDVPVIIVGAGPVGLALAGDLGWRQVPCTLIERSDGSVTQPKMDLVGTRSMEFCRRWGITEQVKQAGYNRSYSQDYAWVTGLAVGHELGREPFPAMEQAVLGPESPENRERCPQDFFDPVLAAFTASFPTNRVRYNAEFLGFEETENYVLCRIKCRRTGIVEELKASYLVGCDGGGSTVREQAAIAMEGSGVLTYTNNAIFRCDGLEKLHDKKPAYRYIFIGEEGTWSTIVAINGRDRWRFSLVGNQTPRKLDESEMRAAIVRAVGREFDFEILSLMPWIRREAVATSYGTQRVLLAGDACHLTSPTGGFGMNTGLQDSVDLGWKLQAMINGWGGAELIRSYEVERRPVALRNVREATNNLKRMLSPRDRLPPAAVFEKGEGGDAARREYGDKYTQMMKQEWFTIGIHLGYRYEGSPIVVPDGTPKPEDAVQTYAPTARPGHRAPHLWLADGRSILDLFGRSFVLLSFDASVSGLEKFLAEAGRQRLPVQVINIDDERAAALYERKLVLVRPDGHVAWRADVVPDDCAAIISRVRGASLSTHPMIERAHENLSSH
jgi:2-polyprenyl-6-methoxyphenol hydroxylase-like FAD-dependent oxidoreductase